MTEENWIIVCRAAGMVNAQIILGRLQTDGIPARLQYEAIGVLSCALDIDGLGEKIVQQLVEVGLVKDVGDLYGLTEDDLIPLERFAEKSRMTLSRNDLKPDISNCFNFMNIINA